MIGVKHSGGCVCETFAYNICKYYLHKRRLSDIVLLHATCIGHFSSRGRARGRVRLRRRACVADVRDVFDLFDFWDGRDGMVDGAKIGDVMRCIGLNPTNKMILNNGGCTKLGLRRLAISNKLLQYWRRKAASLLPFTA